MCYFLLISTLDGRPRAPSSPPTPLRQPLGREGKRVKDQDDAIQQGSEPPISKAVDRNALRCVEYRAVRFLSYFIPLYIGFWQVSGCLVLGAYLASNQIEPNPWYVYVEYSQS